MRMSSGMPIGPWLWLILLVVVIAGFVYNAYKIHLLSQKISRVMGLLIANGWDLETGKRKDGEV